MKKLPGRIAILTESNTGFGKQFAAYGEQNDVTVLRFPIESIGFLLSMTFDTRTAIDRLFEVLD